jgi:hypothetical protein
MDLIYRAKSIKGLFLGAFLGELGPAGLAATREKVRAKRLDPLPQLCFPQPQSSRRQWAHGVRWSVPRCVLSRIAVSGESRRSLLDKAAYHLKEY